MMGQFVGRGKFWPKLNFLPKFKGEQKSATGTDQFYFTPHIRKTDKYDMVATTANCSGEKAKQSASWPDGEEI